MLIVENLPIRDLIGPMSDDELYHFCIANAELRIERDSEHNIIIMSPVNLKSGFCEGELYYRLRLWVEKKQQGVVFGSSTGFYLPNKAMRSPDVAWISDQKWQTIEDKDKEKFSPVVPDFVAEVRSRTDRLSELQNKCAEWIENGVQLLWLIDPKTETTWTYRADGSQEQITGFDKTLSGETVLPGFQFDLSNLYLPK